MMSAGGWKITLSILPKTAKNCVFLEEDLHFQQVPSKKIFSKNLAVTATVGIQIFRKCDLMGAMKTINHNKHDPKTSMDGELKMADGGADSPGLLAAAMIVGKPHKFERPAEETGEHSTPGIQDSIPNVQTEANDRTAKRPVSARRLAANQRNAKKSTGPRSKTGKRIARLNAMKYDRLAGSVVVNGFIAKECPKEFRALWVELSRHLAPVGPLEEILVRKIATATWRQQRATKAESGEIALNVDSGQWQREQRLQDSHRLEWELAGDPLGKMQESAFGNSTLIGWLLQIGHWAVTKGELPEKAIGILCGGRPNRLANGLEKLRLSFPPCPKDGPAAEEHRERIKSQVVAHIGREVKELKRLEFECLKREFMDEHVRQTAATLPDGKTLDKIVRYETALDRQLFRSMEQLERLQRARRGEHKKSNGAGGTVFKDMKNAKRTHCKKIISSNDSKGKVRK